ncbi:transcriptional regulator [Solwaraspora sp. WMMD791]|uniref:transcriptional regulator n=1 Tax=Solwaraspora sp. WMMD791 TaxID=3016086 RepID=UPI00249A64B3|nr:transcriptional regulator [Solwaraspora sp. WMMD791]WFE30325.1 transcriptional regulator [Solwaraspora sp. WMMD791]
MTTGLNEIIHPLHRLQICAMLHPVESLAFAAVRDAVSMSDSALSKQLKVLQEAGYVTVRKEPLNSRIHAWVSLTPLGRTVFTAHMAELRRVADAAVDTDHPPARS